MVLPGLTAMCGTHSSIADLNGLYNSAVLDMTYPVALSTD